MQNRDLALVGYSKACAKWSVDNERNVTSVDTHQFDCLNDIRHVCVRYDQSPACWIEIGMRNRRVDAAPFFGTFGLVHGYRFRPGSLWLCCCFDLRNWEFSNLVLCANPRPAQCGSTYKNLVCPPRVTVDEDEALMVC